MYLRGWGGQPWQRRSHTKMNVLTMSLQKELTERGRGRDFGKEMGGGWKKPLQVDGTEREKAWRRGGKAQSTLEESQRVKFDGGLSTHKGPLGSVRTWHIFCRQRSPPGRVQVTLGRILQPV